MLKPPGSATGVGAVIGHKPAMSVRAARGSLGLKVAGYLDGAAGPATVFDSRAG
ncbi:MAG: hypothetical protein HKL96_11235 [Phycisphaerales bacterium]|nr:hypothetical protein [Phycisphaerales bacterium]